MPDPNWTAEWNWSQSVEQNGFSRTYYGSPVVDEVLSGQPASRRIDINSDNGDAVFITSQVPSLDSQVGVTAEIDCAVNGSGDAGFELTLLDTIIAVNIFQDEVSFYCPTGDNNDPGIDITVATDPNTSYTKWRVTIDNQKRCSLYREGVEVVSNAQVPVLAKPFQRVLWWGEGGGSQSYNGFRFWTGGAMPPG